MLGSSDEIRAALLHAGYSVESLVENALTVVDRAYDVTNVVARRDGQRAFIRIARGCQEGDAADTYLTEAPSGIALRRGSIKLAVDVKDESLARAELTSLLAALEAPMHIDAVTAQVGANGWRVTSSSPTAGDHWDGTWTLRAERIDATLEIGVVSSIRGKGGELSFQSGTAICRLARFMVLVTVNDAAAAEGLASALLHQGSGGG